MIARPAILGRILLDQGALTSDALERALEAQPGSGRRIGELLPFSGGACVFVVVPAATSGGTATRSIVAVDDNGNTL